MPEYVQEQTKTTNGNPQQEQQTHQQPTQHPSQPLEVQPDGTWILGKGANRWMPSKNQIGDLRWIVERELCDELGVPPQDAEDEEKIEFYKRQLALLDLARQAPRCEHVFSDGRCCKAPRVKKGKLCYAHTLMEEKRPQEWNLPPLEDANAVMLWLMDALRGLLEGRISEKTAGLMFYGLQLAMVNARFTTFRDVNFEEMVRKAPRDRRDRRNRASSPTSEGRALPQRTQRNTEEKPAGDFTAKDAEVAKEERRANHSLVPSSERRALLQRTQKNTEEKPAGDFTAEGAEVAKEERRANHSLVPSSERRALLQRTQRNTEGKPAGDFTAENAEVAEEKKPEEGTALRVKDRLEPQNAEGIPGVESAKSIFSGVEVGEGVADNRPVPPPSEPPRKSSQNEVLIAPEEMQHYAGR